MHRGLLMTKHDSKSNDVLIMRLKSGEYDGTHIMKAWITIREQEKELKRKDKRIAELEKENLKAHGWIAKAMMQGLDKVDCSDELLKIIARRDLKQQAKGAESVIQTGDYVSNDWLREEVANLREQAKGGDL